MKILFLANRVPYPPFRGDKLKIYNLAKRLCDKHELHLLTFAQTEEDWTYIDELKKIFKTVQFVSLPKWKSVLHAALGFLNHRPFQVNYFKSAAMHQALASLLEQEQFDVVHVQHLRMAQYLSEHKELPRILDLPDAFSLYWKRKMTNTQRPILKRFEQWEMERVFRYEAVLAQYNLSLVCSKEDKQYLEQAHHLKHIALLPNGVDTDVFAAHGHDYSHNHTLLFTGNMDYGPNIDAVEYFTNSILPLVLQQYPKVQFVIAGQRPVPKVLALASEGIKVTGFIPDLAQQYNAASVVVAPLRFGAGTQNKVLEAMAMAVPVVCSHIGFEGLGIQSGEGAIMQTEPEAFAQSIIALLASEDLRRSVGAQGAAVIRNKFSWDIIALQLEQYFEQVRGKS